VKSWQSNGVGIINAVYSEEMDKLFGTDKIAVNPKHLST